MPKVERANVVEAEDVIGVAMRDEHSVEPLQSLSQGLLAEIRRGVNEDGLPRVLYEDGDAQTLVARISGSAGLALASDAARRWMSLAEK